MEYLSENDLNLLDEVYIGKTKGVQAIEQELYVFRMRYIDNHWNAHINNDPQLIKINRMFEEEFGFGAFCLHIVNLKEVNAFTLPIDYRLDVVSGTNNLIVNKTGYKFNKSAEYAAIVVIYSGLIFNPHFTTGEVMAAILHEIGHNFFASINRNNGVFADTYKSFQIYIMLMNIISGKIPLDAPLAFNSFDKWLLEVMDEARRDKKVAAILVDTLQQVGSFIATAIGSAYKIANLLTFNALNAALTMTYAAVKAMNPITYFTLYIDYKNERAADNFPTIYGYGSELASFIRKAEDSGNSPSEIVNSLNNIPVISALFNTVNIGPTILMYGIDPHPVGVSRAADQMAMLKRELNSASMDPKMEKTIRSDIANIEKEIKIATDVSKKFKDPDIARHLYYRFLYTHMGCNAIKDKLLDDKDKFYQYDKVFYDNLK